MDGMETSSKHVYILLLVNVLVVFICWKLNTPKENNNVHESLIKNARSLSATGKYVAVLTTCPDIEVAKKLSHNLVQVKLAACVNIIPQVTSVYMWKNKVEEDKEFLLVVKTANELIPEVTKFVKDHHPYEVPEVISLSIKDGYEKYLDWIGEVVKGKLQE